MLRFRTVLAAVVGAGLAIPAAAPATLDPIPTVDPGDATPSCPDKPCYALGRTTGYQAKIGTNRGLYVVQKDGVLVSWTIKLSTPTQKQIDFFDKSLGGESQAQISVMRPGTKLHARLVASGDVQKLQPYFGQTVEFPLTTTIPVKKGWIIGLTVPTWAPALAAGLGGDTSWRASRNKGQCDDSQAQTAQAVNQIGRYYCLYRTARIVYSARVISTP
ncbi:hypothetical protein FSW04_21680 [Baekduia soli]|uniref:Uncharacterized protein n=1 Tax=Baekduia soli TaxID=496014 RepID=A0A5B8UA61_9ACTN|nr:hypothetical protein [Baekduia soli]QEC49917.1 hypothetical protein FSW04_21680 [Baekduia soli]